MSRSGYVDDYDCDYDHAGRMNLWRGAVKPVTIDSKTVRGIVTTWSDIADFPKHLKTTSAT